MTPPFLLAVVGPTASGKTELAEALAERYGAHLINSDAFQVYRGMDIGTGKSPHKDLYSLVDLVEPTEQFGLGRWVQLAHARLEELFQEERNAVLVGGTGLYVRALMEEYKGMGEEPDSELRRKVQEMELERGSLELFKELAREHPEEAAGVAASNPLRIRRAWERALSGNSISFKLPRFRKIKIALEPPRDLLRERIAVRVRSMVNSGWLEEAAALKDKGIPAEAPGLKAIGYRLLFECLEGKLGIDGALERITILTQQYAKRQRTWLRSEPHLSTLSWSSDLTENLRAAEAIIDHN